MQDGDVDGDGAVPYRRLHDLIGPWYAKDGQMALRETHGPFPASAEGFEAWPALDEITRAAVDNLDGTEPGLHADLADRYADVRERLRERAAYSSSAALSTVFG